MKVTLEVLFAVAESAMKVALKADQFSQAVAAWANREKKTVTLTTKGHEATKDYGVRVSGTLSTKIDKHNRKDGRAIHWLGLHAEVITFGWEAPSVPDEVKAWLSNFIAEPAKDTEPAKDKK